MKRSITIAGHRTSVSLEESFWSALAAIAGEREVSIAALVAEIDRARPASQSLSSAIRTYVLERFRSGGA